MTLATGAQERAIGEPAVRFDKPSALPQSMVFGWQLLVVIGSFQNCQKLAFIRWSIRGKFGGRSEQSTASICRRYSASRLSNCNNCDVRHHSRCDHLITATVHNLDMQPLSAGFPEAVVISRYQSHLYCRLR